MKKKVIATLGTIAVAGAMMVPTMVGAQDIFGLNYGQNTGLGNQDPRETAARIIRVLLTFLGIVALFIVLYAGFLWMTAQGDTGKVDKAKSMLYQGVIGLLVILSAFALSNFVLNQLLEVTGGGR